MTTWHLDMGTVWLMNVLTWPVLLDVAAYGSKGTGTLTVPTGTGTDYGNYASGKIWSLLTWNNQVVEVASVSGDVITLKQALIFDTVKIRHAYTTVTKEYRMVKIYSAKNMENFNTDFKVDQESSAADKSVWKSPMPTTFFETDIGIGRTLTITGYLLTDNRRSAKQYRDSLWNLIRLGWVHIVHGFLDDFDGDGSNFGMDGYLIKNVKINRKPGDAVNTGKTPSDSYSRDNLRVTIQLLFAPREDTKATDKELVETA